MRQILSGYLNYLIIFITATHFCLLSSLRLEDVWGRRRCFRTSHLQLRLYRGRARIFVKLSQKRRQISNFRKCDKSKTIVKSKFFFVIYLFFPLKGNHKIYFLKKLFFKRKIKNRVSKCKNNDNWQIILKM